MNKFILILEQNKKKLNKFFFFFWDNDDQCDYLVIKEKYFSLKFIIIIIRLLLKL